VSPVAGNVDLQIGKIFRLSSVAGDPLGSAARRLWYRRRAAGQLDLPSAKPFPEERSSKERKGLQGLHAQGKAFMPKGKGFMPKGKGFMPNITEIKRNTNTERFIKTDLGLLALHLPSRLRELYGRLRLYAWKDGKCFAKHATLASEIGLRSDRQVRNLLDQLRQLRLIEWQRGRYSNHYVVLNPDRKWISGLTGNGFPLSDRKRISDRIESSSIEDFKRSPSPTPPPPGAGPRAKPPRKPEASAGKTKIKKSNSDDDEKTKPRPHALTEAEFRAELIERHGATFDADRCLANVRRQLEKCSGLSLTDFLQYDAEYTTAPDAIRNPCGYYVGLAKELRSSAVAAVLDGAYAPLRNGEAAPPEPPRDEHGRCAACRGVGKLLFSGSEKSTPDGAYCTCRLGRDLAKLARRDAEAAKKPLTPNSEEGVSDEPKTRARDARSTVLARRDAEAAKKGPLKEGPPPKVLVTCVTCHAGQKKGA
jgi:hypothetical protein